MKVIFLDFDGVLNGDLYIRRNGGFGVIIDPTRLELLKKIVEATNAKIVLSTSWREHWDEDESKCDGCGLEINRIFEKSGLKVFDKTPQIMTSREEQIEFWLYSNPETENFVVIDDMVLESPILKGHFVKTSGFFGGLSDEDAESAINILNR